MANELELEMCQYAHPVDEVMSVLEAACTEHERVKRLERDGDALRFDFKMPILAPGGLSWVLRPTPFFNGTVVSAFVIKGISYQGSSAAADRGKVKRLLEAVATTLAGNAEAPSSIPLVAPNFGEQHAHLRQQALLALDHAEHCGEQGDMIGEELAIARSERIISSVSGSSAGEWLSAEIHARMDAGRLRRDVEDLGEIGEELKLMSDRILCKRRVKDLVETTVRPLDADVTALVEDGGNTETLTKPSLTRMAVRAVLPRAVNFVLSHPQWKLVVPTDPAAADRVTDLAVRVNSMSGTLPDGEPQSRASVAPAAPTASLADQLRDLAALHRDGLLTEDEFTSAKAKLLEG
ncbi:SHOCT domain-containing protein [Pseudarthrobacter niigatensis]|uniref:SHOCT domain-containing protein n=1 Tax=Pseudarthrobacter niigatensis TaxID=369935 RepID=A0AAJ1SWT8_9MICC|nr:SHOCT domain-containing protein [Pseudarthrobacter niigatensis]MDQ0147609.1 hypothetical protein [Pseudarthrobacter niigatensis]MDQ0267610.1 hypothetical protein [Pseudarthrobacter niigatensis]